MSASPNSVPVSPELKLSERPSLLDYGADPAGTVSSSVPFTDAIANAVSAGYSRSGRLYLGTRVIQLDETIEINNGKGLRIFGDGAMKTVFQWTGNPSDPMFLVEDLEQANFEDFAVDVSDPAYPCDTVFLTQRKTGASYSPNLLAWRGIDVSGIVAVAEITNVTYVGTTVTITVLAAIAALATGQKVTIAGVYGATDSAGTLHGLSNINGSFTVVKISTTQFSYTAAAAPAGSYVRAGSAVINNISYAWRMKVGPGGDVNNDFHEWHRCKAWGFHQAMFSIEGGNAHGLSMDLCESYGGQYAVTTRSNTPRVGHFNWRRGFIANAETAFYLGDNSSCGPISITDLGVEVCGRLLDLAPTNEGQGIFNYAHAVSCENIRFQPQGLASDKKVIKYYGAGSLRLVNCALGLPYDGSSGGTNYFDYAMQIDYSPAGAEGYARRAFEMIGCQIIGSNYAASQIFPSERPTVIDHCVWRTGSQTAADWGAGQPPQVATAAAAGASSLAVTGLASSGTIASGQKFVLDEHEYTLTGGTAITAGAATLAITPVLAIDAPARRPLWVTSGYIGGQAVTISNAACDAQLTLQGKSTTGNKVAGINLKIDETDLYQLLADNDDSNSCVLQALKDPTLRFWRINLAAGKFEILKALLVSVLAGSGTRLVTADATGNLGSTATVALTNGGTGGSYATLLALAEAIVNQAYGPTNYADLSDAIRSQITAANISDALGYVPAAQGANTGAGGTDGHVHAQN